MEQVGDQALSDGVQAPTETMVPASKVNEIVKSRMADAHEKGRRQAMEELRNQAPAMDESHIQEMVAREAQKAFEAAESKRLETARMQDAHRVAQEFIGKLQMGKSKYDDFDNLVGDIDFGQIPQVVQLANMVDNTADVMVELAKNPSKIADLTTLSVISPQLAMKQMQLLSQSIKVNESAPLQKVPEAPLAQLSPTTAAADNGVMTVADYRANPKWRV